MGLTGRRPSGMLRAALRGPIYLYRARLGRLFGHRLVYLAHRGRKTGRRRETVLEVVGYDRGIPEVTVISGWGPGSDWYRNITAAPAVEVRIGTHRWPSPQHRLLDTDETIRVLQSYRDSHPRAWRRIAPVLGIPHDPAGARDHIARIPAVAFSPRQSA